MKYLLAIIIAFSTVFILTPILMKLAFKYNFTDKPTERKKHKGETPLCGGIAMFIGVTTVINWSDGMDGLAGGLSFISAMTFAATAIILGQRPSLLFSLITAGVVLAFLFYNKYPAKVFMGDSGANFLGFILSIIALDGAFKGATILSLMIPILALAVPIFDNIFVIFKRFSEGKPIYQADRSQIHYRLQAKGLNTKQIVTFISIISLTCSVISILLLLIKF